MKNVFKNVCFKINDMVKTVTQPLQQLYWYNPDSAILSFKADNNL